MKPHPKQQAWRKYLSRDKNQIMLKRKKKKHQDLLLIGIFPIYEYL